MSTPPISGPRENVADNFVIPIRTMTRTPFFIFLEDRVIDRLEELLFGPVLEAWKQLAPADARDLGEQLLQIGMIVPFEYEMDEFPCETLREVVAAENPEVRETLNGATNAVCLWASDSLGDPRYGLLLGQIAAVVIARECKGVAVDASTGALLQEESAGAMPTIANQIRILPVPNDATGNLNPRTAGLAKFGVPELEIQDVPHGMEEHVNKLVLGVAHVLAVMATQTAERHEGEAESMPLSSPLTVTAEDVARAMGPGAGFIFTQAQRVELRLTLHAPHQGRPDIGVPDYVPFVADLEAREYDGLIELRAPAGDESLATGAIHWVQTLSQQLGLR